MSSSEHIDHVEAAPQAFEQENTQAEHGFLNIQEAAALLGKSVRALERSLMGRWGNKLPEGWHASKVQTEKGIEWRILPPSGYKVRTQASSENNANNSPDFISILTNDFLGDSKPSPKRQIQRTELNYEQATIVIDRSEEVEQLLRELLVTQKALSEERRLHMEDMRMISHLQGHLRLLETSANETTRIKTELECSQRELDHLKQEYNHVLSLPWWKRIFGFVSRKV